MNTIQFIFTHESNVDSFHISLLEISYLIDHHCKLQSEFSGISYKGKRWVLFRQDVLGVFLKKIQECIPVGYVPSVAVAVSGRCLPKGGGGVCLGGVSA